MNNYGIELWSGDSTGLEAARRDGIEIITVDIESKFNPTICDDILNVTADQLQEHCNGERPFIIWASPDCSVFSVAAFGANHFDLINGVHVPKSPKSLEMIERHKHTCKLIEELNPVYFVIENPVGLLRFMPWMKPYHRDTVTYCQYGDFRMKPTDLWGGFPLTWKPRPMCRNGDDCHEASPRGTKSGTERLNHRERSHIPFELSQEIWEHCKGSKGYRRQTLEDWV